MTISFAVKPVKQSIKKNSILLTGKMGILVVQLALISYPK